jgi:TPR repeat protein
LRRAAEAGHVEAMRNLGILLRKAGRDTEAELWMSRAAKETDRPR